MDPGAVLDKPDMIGAGTMIVRSVKVHSCCGSPHNRPGIADGRTSNLLLKDFVRSQLLTSC